MPASKTITWLLDDANIPAWYLKDEPVQGTENPSTEFVTVGVDGAITNGVAGTDNRPVGQLYGLIKLLASVYRAEHAADGTHAGISESGINFGFLSTAKISNPLVNYTSMDDVITELEWVYANASPSLPGIDDQATATVITLVDSVDPRLGVNTALPAYTVHVTGDIRATGDVGGGYSDARLKTVTGKITNALAFVQSFDAVRYSPNETALKLGIENKPSIGFLAQDFEGEYPELLDLAGIDAVGLEDGGVASKSGENYRNLDYKKISAILWTAVQESGAEIKELKGQMKELNTKIQDLMLKLGE